MSELHWLRLGRVSPVSRRLEVRSERLSSERWAQQVENLPGSQVEGCGTKRFQLPLWIKRNPRRTTFMGSHCLLVTGNHHTIRVSEVVQNGARESTAW